MAPDKEKFSSILRPYVLSFFASCGASLVVTVLVIIYAATGLARDSGFPGGFIRDSDSGELVPVSQINLPTREGAMIVNLLLIILGVLVNIKKEIQNSNF